MLKKQKAIKGKLILTRLWKEFKVYCCHGCKYCTDDEYCTLRITDEKLDMDMYNFCVRITPPVNYYTINYIYIYAEEENTN
jgi:hypothetical protein